MVVVNNVIETYYKSFSVYSLTVCPLFVWLVGSFLSVNESSQLCTGIFVNKKICWDKIPKCFTLL